jgi:hypothetical protein
MRKKVSIGIVICSLLFIVIYSCLSLLTSWSHTSEEHKKFSHLLIMCKTDPEKMRAVSDKCEEARIYVDNLPLIHAIQDTCDRLLKTFYRTLSHPVVVVAIIVLLYFIIKKDQVRIYEHKMDEMTNDMMYKLLGMMSRTNSSVKKLKDRSVFFFFFFRISHSLHLYSKLNFGRHKFIITKIYIITFSFLLLSLLSFFFSFSLCWKS